MPVIWLVWPVVMFTTSCLVFIVRAIWRLVRGSARARRVPPAPTAGDAVGPVVTAGEYEAAAWWLLSAMSREMHPSAVVGMMRATNGEWRPVTALVNAMIAAMSVRSEDPAVAAWALHVTSVNRGETIESRKEAA